MSKKKQLLNVKNKSFMHKNNEYTINLSKIDTKYVEEKTNIKCTYINKNKTATVIYIISND